MDSSALQFDFLSSSICPVGPDISRRFQEFQFSPHLSCSALSFVRLHHLCLSRLFSTPLPIPLLNVYYFPQEGNADLREVVGTHPLQPNIHITFQSTDLFITYRSLSNLHISLKQTHRRLFDETTLEHQQ